MIEIAANRGKMTGYLSGAQTLVELVLTEINANLCVNPDDKELLDARRDLELVTSVLSCQQRAAWPISSADIIDLPLFKVVNNV